MIMQAKMEFENSTISLIYIYTVSVVPVYVNCIVRALLFVLLGSLCAEYIQLKIEYI